ncbi:DoxX family protein [Brumimicrobium mesophilum]|uniref:DoxX family protein n=1 Tax=Brumimicrobium mesophilum TaxID=392717 RepID=UPI000D140BFC|nr:DoxX family protein [Brumimicrobium mesophilum]
MDKTQKISKTLNIILWITQIILALVLISGAIIKIFLPRQELQEMFSWTADNGTLLILTAFADLLLGIGIILPRPKINILAAYGLMLLMIAASIFHIYRNEASDIGINIFLLLLSIFIIFGKRKM